MNGNSKAQVSLPESLLLDEPCAAALIGESPQTRRIRRYDDQKRLQAGKQITGPAWIRDGKRVKYRMADLQAYVASLTPFQG